MNNVLSTMESVVCNVSSAPLDSEINDLYVNSCYGTNLEDPRKMLVLYLDRKRSMSRFRLLLGLLCVNLILFGCTLPGAHHIGPLQIFVGLVHALLICSVLYYQAQSNKDFRSRMEVSPSGLRVLLGLYFGYTEINWKQIIEIRLEKDIGIDHKFLVLKYNTVDKISLLSKLCHGFSQDSSTTTIRVSASYLPISPEYLLKILTARQTAVVRGITNRND